MNRNTFIKSLAVAVLVINMACHKSHDDKKDEESKIWKEMDEFHMVMAETFHPYKDSADLAPVKAKIKDLVAAADKWSQSELPEKVENDEMKSKLQQLKGETEALADIVEINNDAAIGDQLTKVHNLFHKIQEMWYGKGEHHQH
jgi:hypothetical protein